MPYLPRHVDRTWGLRAIKLITHWLEQGAHDGTARVPMPGGWGTLFAGLRRAAGAPCCHEGLRPKLRAYVVLGLVGARNPDGDLDDNWYGKEFRLAAAVMIEQSDLAIDDVPLASLELHDRWPLVLAALLLLAQGIKHAKLYYESACARLKGSKGSLAEHASTTTEVVIGKRGAANASDAGWKAVQKALSDPARRNALLVRYLFHVVHALLFAVPPKGRNASRAFYVQWERWFDLLRRTAALASRCAGNGAALHELAGSLHERLARLEPCNGPEALDPGSPAPDVELPGCFRPYAGGPLPWPDLFEHALDPNTFALMENTHRLALLLVDKLLDPMQLRRANPPEGGFNWMAYRYLRGMMGWSRTSIEADPRRDEASGAQARPRTQLQRLVVEWVQERCAVRVAALVSEAAMPPQGPVCALCATAFD